MNIVFIKFDSRRHNWRRPAVAMITAVFLAMFHVAVAPMAFAEPLKIGTASGPLVDILNFATARAKEQGLDVKVIEFSDWVTPNEALQNGEIAANLYQTIPFLNAAAEARGYKFTILEPTVVSQGALYSKKIRKLEELREGATAAVANDPVNEARGLSLFVKAGLIKLREGSGERATIRDIVENPKKIKFLEIEAPQLPRVLQDVDIAHINTFLIIDAGWNPDDISVYNDRVSDPYYAIRFVARTDRKDEPRLIQFISIYRSPEVKDYVAKKYGRFLSTLW